MALTGTLPLGGAEVAQKNIKEKGKKAHAGQKTFIPAPSAWGEKEENYTSSSRSQRAGGEENAMKKNRKDGKKRLWYKKKGTPLEERSYGEKRADGKKFGSRKSSCLGENSGQNV